MKVDFLTLGCKVNQYETEAMKEKFLERGYELSSEGDVADVFIINTCTVTNLADRKSRQYIRRARNDNPDAVIAVTGCYAQMDAEAVKAIPGVNIIAGTNEKRNVVDYVEEELDRRKRFSGIEAEDEGEIPCHIKAYEELGEYESDGVITAMESRTRAFVKIEEGCNRFCTYCIIPYARGKVRSRDEDEIIEEVRGLIARGFKEIVLTGINTALYGADRGGFGLASLLRKLDELKGDFRIRLSSLEPTVVTEDDVNGILKSERLCHHLHLSIQSGSDNVLRLMGRRYSRDEYLRIVKLLRDFDPAYGITTDVIVGFPGESEEDFRDSVDTIRRAEVSKVHAFRYSPRRGTKAAEMPDQVSGEDKNSRAKRLIEASEEVSRAFLDRMKGSEERVLFEEKKGKDMVGYSDNYTRVYLPYDETCINEFVTVRLLEPYKDGMKGERNG